MITLIGISAGIMTSGCLIPQVIKTYKSKSTRDFSRSYLIIMECGLALWEVYGLLTKDVPIIIANTFGFILVGYILYVKVSDKNRSQDE